MLPQPRSRGCCAAGWSPLAPAAHSTPHRTFWWRIASLFPGSQRSPGGQSHDERIPVARRVPCDPSRPPSAGNRGPNQPQDNGACAPRLACGVIKTRHRPPVPRPRRILDAARSDYVISALKKERHRYQRLGKACGKKPRRKTVHACRTAGRRILALLTLLKGVTSASDLIEARRSIKQGLKPLAPLRDTDVHLRYVETFHSRHAHLKWLGRELRHERKQMKRAVRRNFKKGHAAKHLQLIGNVLEVASTHRAFRATWRSAAVEAVKAASTQAFTRQPKVAQGLPLHRARAALRKLWYLADFFGPVFSRSLGEPLEQLHAIQSIMGHLHDLELMSARAVQAAMGRKRRQKSLKVLCSAASRRQAELTREYWILAPKIFRRSGGVLVRLGREFSALLTAE